MHIQVCLCSTVVLTLREEYWVDLEPGPIPQSERQLLKVEALQVEADLDGLSGSFHLVGDGHVCGVKQGSGQLQRLNYEDGCFYTLWVSKGRLALCKCNMHWG